MTCGASNPRNINAPGRDAKGIYFAVDYLKRVTKHLRNPQYTDYINAKDKNVLVIGGGDTGNDCVGSSIRQGAKSVVQLEMMPKPPVCRWQAILGRSGRKFLRPITVSRKQSLSLAVTRESMRPR